MTNEPLDETEAAIAGPDDEAERKARLVKAGIGLGIGSAALVAALLYANQHRKKKAPAAPAEPIDRD